MTSPPSTPPASPESIPGSPRTIIDANDTDSDGHSTTATSLDEFNADGPEVGDPEVLNELADILADILQSFAHSEMEAEFLRSLDERLRNPPVVYVPCPARCSPTPLDEVNCEWTDPTLYTKVEGRGQPGPSQPARSSPGVGELSNALDRLTHPDLPLTILTEGQIAAFRRARRSHMLSHSSAENGEYIVQSTGEDVGGPYRITGDTFRAIEEDEEDEQEYKGKGKARDSDGRPSPGSGHSDESAPSTG